MSRDMAMVLGGRLLPKPSTFQKTDTINGVDTRTLGGVLYTDFRDRLRSWELTWDNILWDTDFQTITDIWEQQLETRTYPMLQFDSENLYVAVKIDIGEQKIRYNGTVIERFVVRLTEQNPIS